MIPANQTFSGRKKAALSFTGGKDCLLALSEIYANPNFKTEVTVTVLVTFGPPEAFLEDKEEEVVAEVDNTEPFTVDDEKDCRKPKKKKSFLAHPLRVIKLQARALGLPHVVFPVVGPSYLESYVEALKKLMIDHHVSHLVTGDILDVCQQFMQRVADKAGMVLLRPLWERPRRELLSLLERSSPPPSLSPSLHPVSCSCPSALSSAPSSFTLLISCCSVEKMGITRARDFVALCGDKALQKLLNLARRNEERDKQRGLEDSQDLGREKESLEGKQEGVPGAEGEGREGKEGIVSGIEGHRKVEVIDKEVEDTAIDACGEGGEYHSMVLDMPLFTHGYLSFNDQVQIPPVLESDDGKYLYCDLGALGYVERPTKS